ncbi:hypothetical protein AVEN_259844-1 [Araneus ventricosus]|uniref:Uncharacterized protein n=1 Tax=Araneus ventricosus TaxID=182803 RepID=A0A4Y2BD14_ARAVE|nr:hypothetical protein AVEN_259844-1 [Araneus ventricosus]
MGSEQSQKAHLGVTGQLFLRRFPAVFLVSRQRIRQSLAHLLRGDTGNSRRLNGPRSSCDSVLSQQVCQPIGEGGIFSWPCLLIKVKPLSPGVAPTAIDA